MTEQNHNSRSSRLPPEEEKKEYQIAEVSRLEEWFLKAAEKNYARAQNNLDWGKKEKKNHTE
jgi:hypothetical protein